MVWRSILCTPPVQGRGRVHPRLAWRSSCCRDSAAEIWLKASTPSVSVDPRTRPVAASRPVERPRLAGGEVIIRLAPHGTEQTVGVVRIRGDAPFTGEQDGERTPATDRRGADRPGDAPFRRVARRDHQNRWEAPVVACEP